ncbi:TauD/TfdA family dioxygenase [Candidatus Saccharibacteria bacterium]|nr:TauD/TfdA family dioxygenase [Candidatus Saccharibacteria bacterium]
MTATSQTISSVGVELLRPASINSGALEQLNAGYPLLLETLEPARLSQTLQDLGAEIGRPYIDTKESPFLVQSIKPEEDALDQSSNSFNGELRMHTENPYEDLEPDFLLIGCSANSEQAVTLISDGNIAFSGLAEPVRKRLQEPRFSVLEAGKFAAAAGRARQMIAQNVPVAKIADDGKFDFQIDFEATVARGLYKDALEQFEHRCRAIAREIILNPGDVLVLPNQRVIHGRKSFNTNTKSPERRQLLRMFVQKG